VPRPSGLLTATDDADVARLVLRNDQPPVRVAHGDLARTLGSPSSDDAPSVLELPLDLVDVTCDGGDLVACAHVVVRRRWMRGGWWFGPVTVVMNAEFIGDWDVAPRGHPNDGRVEVLQADTAMSLRERFAVRRRLPGGMHVPHPSIATRSVREAAFEFEQPMVVVVDGIVVGSSRSLSVRVRPDAAIVYA
jgi:hypothetical protein